MERVWVFACLLFFLSITYAFATFDVVFTQENCKPVYGGGQMCPSAGSIKMNKTVLNPKTQEFVDELGQDEAFTPNQLITFKISITNTDSKEVDKLIIKDILPQFVEFVDGQGPVPDGTRQGTFDPDTKTFSSTIKLNSNESKDIMLRLRVITADKLPQDTTCVVNQANTTFEGKFSQDSTQICIQTKIPTQTPNRTKGGLPVKLQQGMKTTPSTGTQSLGLIAIVASGISGWFLRKVKAKI